MTEPDSASPNDETAAPADDPGVAVMRYLSYALSLPERAFRAGTAALGGMARESAALLVPRSFQNSKSYEVMLRQMLDFLAYDVGRVERPVPEPGAEPAPPPIENFLARKAVGNFIDMAHMATLHLSPLVLLAAVSDLAYGSQVYLAELADELKREGVIDQGCSIQHIDDLLSAVAAASNKTADAFNAPPLSVDGLRQTIDETREALRLVDPKSVIPQAEIARLWDDVRQLAAREGVSPLEISGAMTLFALSRMQSVAQGALSSVRVAGRLFDRHVIDHYETAVGEIRQRGLYATLRETSAPYIEAMWQNFSTDQSTITEDVLSGKLLGSGLSAVRRWLGRGDAAETS